MKVLIDTNVLIDFIAKREPYFANADKIVNACLDNKISGCIAAHSVCDMFYILRRTIAEDKRRRMLKQLCTIFEVIGIGETELVMALDNAEFTDFEDCLQTECANKFGAEYVITRNIKDYEKSSVKAITPEEMIEYINGKK